MTATDTAPRTFAVLGTTTDVLVCELCGRDDLTRTVVLDALDGEGNRTGALSYYGTTCGAHAAGWRQRDLEREAREADERAKVEARNAHQREAAAAARADEAAKVAWLEELAGRPQRPGEHWADLAEAAGFDRPFLAYKAWEAHKGERGLA